MGVSGQCHPSTAGDEATRRIEKVADRNPDDEQGGDQGPVDGFVKRGHNHLEGTRAQPSPPPGYTRPPWWAWLLCGSFLEFWVI